MSADIRNIQVYTYGETLQVVATVNGSVRLLGRVPRRSVLTGSVSISVENPENCPEYKDVVRHDPREEAEACADLCDDGTEAGEHYAKLIRQRLQNQNETTND